MKDWVSLQLSLYRSLKKETLSLLKARPASFLKYEREFLRDQKNFEDSDHRELTSELNQADITFIGDFHTLRQSQRLLLRLLRDRDVRKPSAVGLEVLSPSHLSNLQTWLEAPTPKSEAKLRELLDLESKWGSNFETYKEIFLWCKNNKVKIFPLRSGAADLKTRDRLAAKSLSKVIGRVWVLFGEFHCARSHLPANIQKISPLRKLLVIQQNDDQATLKRLSALSIKKTMILRAPSKKNVDLFCILHTPLWMKYQSYLEKHLQKNEEEEFETLDALDQISWSLKTLIKFLDDPRYPSKKKTEDILDFNALRPEDSLFYKSILRLPLSERRSALAQIKSGSLAVLPDRKCIFLSELTVNSCAQAAGLYLYLIWSGTRFQRGEFFKQTLTESMAFFMSKLLNHSRRANSWKSWVNLSRGRAQQREALAILQTRTFVTQTASKERWLRKIKPFENQAAVALGRNLADAAFEAFLAGEFSLPRLVRLMKTRIREESEAFEVLVELKSIGRAFLSHDAKNW